MNAKMEQTRALPSLVGTEGVVVPEIDMKRCEITYHRLWNENRKIVKRYWGKKTGPTMMKIPIPVSAFNLTELLDAFENSGGDGGDGGLLFKEDDNFSGRDTAKFLLGGLAVDIKATATTNLFDKPKRGRRKKGPNESQQLFLEHKPVVGEGSKRMFLQQCWDELGGLAVKVTNPKTAKEEKISLFGECNMPRTDDELRFAIAKACGRKVRAEEQEISVQNAMSDDKCAALLARVQRFYRAVGRIMLLGLASDEVIAVETVPTLIRDGECVVLVRLL